MRIFRYINFYLTVDNIPPVRARAINNDGTVTKFVFDFYWFIHVGYKISIDGVIVNGNEIFSNKKMVKFLNEI